MKRVFSPLLLSCLAAVLLAACSTADDTQATRKAPSVGFVNLSEEQSVPPGHQFQIFASAESGLSALSVRIDDQPAQDLPLQGTNTVTLPTDLSDGEHQLVATVTDDQDVTRSAARRFVVDSTLGAPDDGGDVVDPGDDGGSGGGSGPNMEPEVRVDIIRPVAGVAVGLTTEIEFLVSTRDTEAEIVTLYVNGTVLEGLDIVESRPATGEFANEYRARSWDTTAYPDGAATIEVVVEDGAGNLRDTATVLVDVLNSDIVEPTFRWMSPARSATVDGVVDVEFEAEDADGTATVDLFLDDVLLEAEAPSPYAWDTTSVADGTHELKAVTTDQAGNETVESLSLIVANGDSEDPVLLWMSPTPEETVQGEIDLTFTATDNAGSPMVDVWVDEVLVGGGVSSPFAWNSATVPDGAHDVVLIARDDSGNEREVSRVIKTANDPTIEWMTPASTRPVAGDVPLEVAVDGGRGDVNVSLWYVPSSGDPQPIALDTETTATWSTMMLQPGTYTLIARATDAYGFYDEKRIEVEVESALVITNPESGETVGPSAGMEQVDVRVGLTGTVRDGPTIKQVEILIGAVKGDRIATMETDTADGAVFVYSWDVCEPAGAGHDLAKPGDRTITALVTLTDDTTLLSDGIDVLYDGSCL